jgi:hypothetical protein
MGGVGVATGNRYASFTNPALLTTADETHEWFLLLPTVGQYVGDRDKVEDNLAAFQQAADTLASVPTATNRNVVQARLNALNGGLYREGNNTAIMLAIPSRILSGAAFLNVYDHSTAQPQIGGDDLSDPVQYNSSLTQRGVRVLENGVSAAWPLEANAPWKHNLSVGFNAKFLLIEGYGYSEPLRNAAVDIDRDDRKTDAQFQFDLGLLKELGVWKLGLVVRNILPGRYDYGASGETFKFAPQLRAGFAYQSRRTVLELDLDLTKNAAIGSAEPTQIVALGGEWYPWRWLGLRAGYRQNLTGTQVGYGALGVGLRVNAVHIDVAAFAGDEDKGFAAQLGFQF